MNDRAINIINEISNIRANNNLNWVGVLKLAVKYAPAQEVVNLFSGIDSCDSEIGKQFKKLVNVMRERAAHEGQ
jgi:hypothetical protein